VGAADLDRLWCPTSVHMDNQVSQARKTASRHPSHTSLSRPEGYRYKCGHWSIAVAPLRSSASPHRAEADALHIADHNQLV
jgi:hypothetical protein